MTPEGKLYQAVKHGDYSGVDDALVSGADYGTLRIDGKSLLQFAGELGCRRICERLVKEGADVNETGGARRYSLLHHAVASSNFGMASILLDLGAKASPLASNNATPLHIAARSGQCFLAEKLIAHGAELDAVDSRVRTPLHWAAEKEDLSMIKLLLNKGCNVNPFDRDYRSPLSIAMAKGNNEIKELLLRHGAKYREPGPQKHANKVAEHPDNQGRLF